MEIKSIEYTEDELAVLMDLVNFDGDVYRHEINNNYGEGTLTLKFMKNLSKKIKQDYLNKGGDKSFARRAYRSY